MTSDKRTLSPSAFGNYEICGRRGEFYHTPDIQRVTSMPLAIGSGYHAGLEDGYTNGFDQVEMLATAIDKLIELYEDDSFVSNEGDKTAQEAHEIMRVMIASYFAEGAEWERSTVRGVEVEVRGDFNSPSHEMHGFIDLAVQPKAQAEVVLVDHKTAGRMWSGSKVNGDPRKLIQAPLYAEAWYQQTGVDVSWFAYDVMTYAGKFKRVWVPVHKEARAPFVERWAEMAATIELHKQAGIHMPTNPSGFLCSSKWCSYWELCPMGAATDSAIINTIGGVT